MVKLTNRIEALRMRDDDPDEGDVPADAKEAAKEGVTKPSDSKSPSSTTTGKGTGRLSRAARSAIFREVVLAKVREMKAEEEKQLTERTLSEKKPGSRK
jgi:calcium/calmodulin-dependent protein kinase I